MKICDRCKQETQHLTPLLYKTGESEVCPHCWDDWELSRRRLESMLFDLQTQIIREGREQWLQNPLPHVARELMNGPANDRGRQWLAILKDRFLNLFRQRQVETILREAANKPCMVRGQEGED